MDKPIWWNKNEAFKDRDGKGIKMNQTIKEIEDILRQSKNRMIEHHTDYAKKMDKEIMIISKQIKRLKELQREDI